VHHVGFTIRTRNDNEQNCTTQFQDPSFNIDQTFRQQVGRGSSVGIANGYRLDGPGIESWWGWDFSHTSRPALGPIQGTGPFPRVKRPGCGADHPPPPSAEVENEYCYTSTPPLGPWWPVVGWPLPLHLHHRSSNFFQVGTIFISQNVPRPTLLLSPLKANCLRFSTIVCDTKFTFIWFFLSFLD
jgi:hypothetical protein